MKLCRLIVTVLCALQLSLALALAAHADTSTADTRAAFLKVIDHARVPPLPDLTELPAVEGLRKQHLQFWSEANVSVPGYLLLPDPAKFPGRRPVVIALHGTGGSKDSGQIAEIVLKAVRAGFIGVAIDGRYHGERILTRSAGKAPTTYDAAIAHVFSGYPGHPLYYDTVWDVMRLIDYLQTRPDVDGARIGLTGISKGGIETYLAAAADPRIAAAVPYIGVQSFKWELDNGQWHARIHTIQDGFDTAAKAAGRSTEDVQFVRAFYARVVPGIDGEFDGPAMLPLIAPRPLLVVNGDSDANTPIAGVRLAVNAAKTAYDAANASEHLQLMIEADTPHRVNPEALGAGIAWFVRWLNP
jgi:dienelactone hydrolase